MKKKRSRLKTKTPNPALLCIFVIVLFVVDRTEEMKLLSEF
jgi:hypothetical protein